MDTRFGCMMAGSGVLALALAWTSVASAQEEGCPQNPTACLTDALGGVVDGFTGAAGGDLWGWMMGGGQSAGIDAIGTELNAIEKTLGEIEQDLSEIERELENLKCGFDVDFITQYAGPIQSYYQTYANWLTDMCNPDAEGNCQSTGTSLPAVSDVSEWANCAVGFPTAGQTCQDDKILTLLNDLNDAATAIAGAGGSIADCVTTKGGPPATGSLDDRPYYSDNVVPITDWYLGINTQAMITLTEAYHFRAWQAAGSPTSSDADGIYGNVCGTGSTPDGCVEPITVYNNDFLEFTKDQLRAGGAPYSTDEYLMVNGQDYLIARSIEQYTKVLDPDNALGCSTTEPGKLTSAPGDVCGASTGLYSDTLFSFDFGPYNYGRQTTGGGTWVSAPYTLFIEFLKPFNSSAPGSLTLTDFVCTMSISGGDASNCTQPNGGAGLFLGKKIIIHPETDFNSWIQSNIGSRQLIFTDGGLQRQHTNQPISARQDLLVFDDVAKPPCGADFEFYEQQGWTREQIDPRWYAGKICLPGEFSPPPVGWIDPGPGYNPPDTYPQYQWAALDWTKLPCSNGEAANDPSNLNPAGVPALCGSDFETWFEALVPPGPTQATAVADATLDRFHPNTNDGAGPLLRVGHKRRGVVGFDRDALQALLRERPLGSARLVLSSADTSAGGRGHWVAASPVRAGFVEGSGNAGEHDRGVGSGATWNCAEDAEISDFWADCLQHWSHGPRHWKGPSRWRHAWGARRHGPRHGGRASAVVFQKDGFDGRVSWDVTKDVERGVSAWLIRRVHGHGSLAYLSREGAAALDDPSLAPILLLIAADEAEVVADAK